MSNILVSSQTGSATSDRVNIKLTDCPVTVSATGLAGAEVVDIQISQDDGATFANTGVQLDATTNTKAVTSPGIYKFAKSATAASVAVALHINENL